MIIIQFLKECFKVTKSLADSYIIKIMKNIHGYYSYLDKRLQEGNSGVTGALPTTLEFLLFSLRFSELSRIEMADF